MTTGLKFSNGVGELSGSKPYFICIVAGSPVLCCIGWYGFGNISYLGALKVTISPLKSYVNLFLESFLSSYLAFW